MSDREDIVAASPGTPMADKVDDAVENLNDEGLLVVRGLEQGVGERFITVSNWFEELKERMGGN